MTVNGMVINAITAEKFETGPTDQVEFFLMWESRGTWYKISEVTLTHNEGYPTPAINITAPSPGIRFTVSDADGNTLYTNVKEKVEK